MVENNKEDIYNNTAGDFKIYPQLLVRSIFVHGYKTPTRL